MLGDLQRRFKQAMLSEQTEGLDWIADKPPLDRAGRIGIYTYAYFARLTDNLREDFEIFAAAVGEERFDRLAKELFSKSPTAWVSANEVGRDFPDFISAHPEFRDDPGMKDLVHFEWALVEAFYAPYLERTGEAKIPTATPADWGKAKLILDPSARLIATEWDLYGLIQNPDQPLTRKPTWFVIHRLENEAQWQTLTEGQYGLLQKLARAIPLQEAAQGLDGTEFGPEIFADWWNEGVIRSISWD